MRYAGIVFSKIEAEKFEQKTEGNIQVNSNFNLGKIAKEDLGKDAKKPIFSFEFTYILKYDKIAEISFMGKIYIEIDDKDLIKELEKENARVTNKELSKLILDVVLARTHVESLHLEEKLNLPFHIQSPRVTIGSKE
ncbi:hypothetical protein HY449_04835 [Candidatus Pacearchaeota archaeon]|nr:hypothetical protein [Candidatus Pacearchaeota archaeon]